MLAEATEAVAPMRVAVKVYDDPLKLAREKYPNLNWDHKNEMPSAAWLTIFRQYLEATYKGAEACRNIDTVFGDVIRGSTQFHCYLPLGETKFELWDDQVNRWEKGRDSKSMFNGFVPSIVSGLAGSASMTRAP